MKNYRYGKIPLFNYLKIMLFPFVISILIIVCCVVAESPFWYALPFLCISVFYVASILHRTREQFLITDEEIIVYNGRKERIIPLPQQMLIIVSYAEILPSWESYSVHIDKKFVLKNSFAITILQSITKDETIELLKKSLIKEHTTRTLENVFYGYRYVYSFVFDDFLLDKLIANKNAEILVSQSLFDKVKISRDGVNVCVY